MRSILPAQYSGRMTEDERLAQEATAATRKQPQPEVQDA